MSKPRTPSKPATKISPASETPTQAGNSPAAAPVLSPLAVAAAALVAEQGKYAAAKGQLDAAAKALGQGTDADKEVAARIHAAALTSCKCAEEALRTAVLAHGKLACEDTLSVLCSDWKQLEHDYSCGLVGLGKRCLDWLADAKEHYGKGAKDELRIRLEQTCRTRVDYGRAIKIYQSSLLFGLEFLDLPQDAQKSLSMFAVQDKKTGKWAIDPKHADAARKLYERAIKEPISGKTVRELRNDITGKGKAKSEEISPASETPPTEPTISPAGEAPTALPDDTAEATGLIARLLLSRKDRDLGKVLFGLGQNAELRPDEFEEFFYGMATSNRLADLTVLAGKLKQAIIKAQADMSATKVA